MGVGVGDQLGNAAMPDSHERKRVANAGLFIGGLSELFADELAAARSPTARTSLRSFDDAGGAVGLGIVAAMSGAPVGRGLPPAPRSEPIPIGSVRAAAEASEAVAKEEELSESYTCVIWHVDGGSLARKRVYFDGASVP
ncbi:hypothetical protein Cni_G28594 [Canna indica]|uniref:Uncharacterized protein n=1 Tax=Canna indica TaxID=4628 RepID=A0AAQ3L5T0_9LILI|nr:hypothetical protein Cni_G28594 [Canna indica]